MGVAHRHARLRVAKQARDDRQRDVSQHGWPICDAGHECAPSSIRQIRAWFTAPSGLPIVLRLCKHAPRPVGHRPHHSVAQSTQVSRIDVPGLVDLRTPLALAVAGRLRPFKRPTPPGFPWRTHASRQRPPLGFYLPVLSRRLQPLLSPFPDFAAWSRTGNPQTV